MTADMRYMDMLVGVVSDAVRLIQEKTLTYGDSWKRRGGPGAWFTTVRPWDRLEKIVERHGGDIFAAIAADPSGADGSALACVRDLMNYMILIEAHARVAVTQHTASLATPEAGSHHALHDEPDEGTCRGCGCSVDEGMEYCSQACRETVEDRGDPSRPPAATVLAAGPRATPHVLR